MNLQQHNHNPLLYLGWQTSAPEMSQEDLYLSASQTEGDAALYPSPPLSDGNSPSSSAVAAQIPPHNASIPLISSSLGTAKDNIISVSTSFCPGTHQKKHDIVFSSIDGVLFYVHTQTIRRGSPTAFSSLLSRIPPGGSRGIITLPEPSVVLNVIFHTLYGTSCAQNSPSLDDLVQAVDCMPTYDVIPQTLILPQTPLYTLLLSYAPLQPMTVYSLAGHHELAALAEQTSSHLLAYPLPMVDDTLALRMGAVYLRRLFMLHWKRLSYLKEFVVQPPPRHIPTKDCSTHDQSKLTRAWSLAAASLVWDARPDLSTHMISVAFESLIENVSCKECRVASKARIRQVVTQWAAVKCTI